MSRKVSAQFFPLCHLLRVVTGISDTLDYEHVGNTLHFNTQETETSQG